MGHVFKGSSIVCARKGERSHLEGETHWEIHNRDTVRVTERNTHTETHTLKGTNTELAMHTERDKHTLSAPLNLILLGF